MKCNLSPCKSKALVDCRSRQQEVNDTLLERHVVVSRVWRGVFAIGCKCTCCIAQDNTGGNEHLRVNWMPKGNERRVWAVLPRG